MGSKTPIVVCGDAGAVRELLLDRKDVELYWTSSIEEALSTIRHVRPRLVLTRLELSDGPAFTLLRQLRSEGGPSAIVILSEGEQRLRAACCIAGASEAVPMEDSTQILQLISDFTGLMFAKDPRADFSASVEVGVGNESFLTESINISASGIALRGFPVMTVGTPISLRFVKERKLPKFQANVVRCWVQGEHSMAALRFNRLGLAQARWLRRIVDTEGASLVQAQPGIKALFMDLNLPQEASCALATGDISALPSSALRVATGSSYSARLKQYLKSPGDRSQQALEVPEWLPSLASGLTQIERKAVLGSESPEWAIRSVETRLRIAEWRARKPSAQLDPQLAEGAYYLFKTLPNEVSSSDDRIRADVSAIRAALLRELLKHPERPGRRRPDRPVHSGRNSAVA